MSPNFLSRLKKWGPESFGCCYELNLLRAAIGGTLTIPNRLEGIDPANCRVYPVLVIPGLFLVPQVLLVGVVGEAGGYVVVLDPVVHVRN